MKLPVTNKNIFDMKRLLFVLAIAVMTVMAGCSKDDEKGISVNNEVRSTFAQKYPDASHIKWKLKTDYYVAEFTMNYTAPDGSSFKADADAWFDNSGVWYMTEVDLMPNRIPAAISEALASSRFAGWKIEDAEIVERNGMAVVYVLEVEGVENGVKVEYDLYFMTDGTLVKEVLDESDNDDHSDYIPLQIAETIKNTIAAMYPGSQIVEIEKEKNYTEVDILHNGVKKEVLFTDQGVWVSTKYDVSSSVLSSAIQSLLSTAYADYYIDDVDKVETTDGEYYEIELEKRAGSGEITIMVKADGTLIQ